MSKKKPLNLEEKITNLQNQLDKYNSLPEPEKLEKITEYNNMISELESCKKILDEYKQEPESKPINKLDISIQDLFQKIEKLKQVLDKTELCLEDLLESNKQLIELQNNLDKYLESKKLEITYL